MKYTTIEFKELQGKTFSKVEYKKVNDEDELIFTVNGNLKYKLFHREECGENVTLEDICGDLNDLVGTPILVAEEVSNSDGPGIEGRDKESFSWTFYKLDTIKGGVTLRWYGDSNGCYSEKAELLQIES